MFYHRVTNIMGEPGTSRVALSRDIILRAFEMLSSELARAGLTGELCLFGGTVMVLAFNSRPSTKDVDAVFTPPGAVRVLAKQIAEELKLPDNWLNDGVKGFVSARHETTFERLPQFPNLRVAMPVPEYLLAMKCMASRVGTMAGEASDVEDIIFLCRHLNLKSAEAVLDLVASYYPSNQIPIKTQFLIEGLFSEGKI